MEIQKRDLNDAESYINFVREFVTLLDKQFLVWEQSAENGGSMTELVTALPALISMTNTVGYLRGQDGMFLDIRPITDHQKELYAYEDLFELRLRKLINKVMSSKESEIYLSELNKNFIDMRTVHE